VRNGTHSYLTFGMFMAVMTGDRERNVLDIFHAKVLGYSTQKLTLYYSYRALPFEHTTLDQQKHSIIRFGIYYTVAVN
jgi:hypothetical protein